MIKIMFVCHGNICRSPMAEMILRDMVRKRGIAERFRIASSATSTEEIWGDRGNPIYPPAQETLRSHKIPFTMHYAVQLRKFDYAEYDWLICMDSANIRNAARITGGDQDGKIRRLLDFTDTPRDVADPWYSGDFEQAFADIVYGCECFLKYCADGGMID